MPVRSSVVKVLGMLVAATAGAPLQPDPTGRFPGDYVAWQTRAYRPNR